MLHQLQFKTITQSNFSLSLSVLSMSCSTTKFELHPISKQNSCIPYFNYEKNKYADRMEDFLR